MSLSDYLLTNLLTLDSSRIKENFDRTVTTDEFLHEETSRTATFTLGSSSSSSSTCSLNVIDDDDEEISHEKTKSDHRLLTHSQSLTLECQRRRPVIQDPYRISPDRQLLDDWMIVSVLQKRPDDGEEEEKRRLKALTRDNHHHYKQMRLVKPTVNSTLFFLSKNHN